MHLPQNVRGRSIPQMMNLHPKRRNKKKINSLQNPQRSETNTLNENPSKKKLLPLKSQETVPYLPLPSSDHSPIRKSHTSTCIHLTNCIDQHIKFEAAKNARPLPNTRFLPKIPCRFCGPIVYNLHQHVFPSFAP
jgi:hypothetical protein